MPTSLAAIHTSRSLGAPQAQGLSSSRSDEGKGEQAGVALPRMADAIKQVGKHTQSSYFMVGASAANERAIQRWLSLNPHLLRLSVVGVIYCVSIIIEERKEIQHVTVNAIVLLEACCEIHLITSYLHWP